LWGAQRQTKYDWLDEHQVENTPWKKLEPTSPDYLFIPQDTRRRKEYERGWKVTDMMPVTIMGPNSHRDGFAIAFSHEEAVARLKDLTDPKLSASDFLRRYGCKENAEWTVGGARAGDLRPVVPRRCLYRPFDERYMLWGAWVFDRPRQELINQFLQENLGLISTRQTKELFSVFSTTLPVGQHKLATPYDGSYVSPLYLHPNGKLPEADLFAHENGRRPNFSAAFIQDFSEKLQVEFVPEGLGRPAKREAGPESIFNYAYAVFHSPAYRERYAEFLRADFARLPLTHNLDLFQELAGLGGWLVDLHARGQGLNSQVAFPEKGTDQVTDIRFQPVEGLVIPGKRKMNCATPGAPVEKGTWPDIKAGRVWINEKQYFEPVPEMAWMFPVGGYLPAQRWLKDRTGRKLGFDEQLEYQRIISALIETRRLMAEVDSVIQAHSGWPLK
jgi:hypothetical protein